MKGRIIFPINLTGKKHHTPITYQYFTLPILFLHTGNLWKGAFNEKQIATPGDDIAIGSNVF